MRDRLQPRRRYRGAGLPINSCHRITHSTAARPSLCLKGVCSLATHVASLARLDQGRITGSDLKAQATRKRSSSVVVFVDAVQHDAVFG